MSIMEAERVKHMSFKNPDKLKKKKPVHKKPSPKAVTGSNDNAKPGSDRKPR